MLENDEMEEERSESFKKKNWYDIDIDLKRDVWLK